MMFAPLLEERTEFVKTQKKSQQSSRRERHALLPNGGVNDLPHVNTTSFHTSQSGAEYTQ